MLVKVLNRTTIQLTLDNIQSGWVPEEQLGPLTVKVLLPSFRRLVGLIHVARPLVLLLSFSLLRHCLCISPSFCLSIYPSLSLSLFVTAGTDGDNLMPCCGVYEYHIHDKSTAPVTPVDPNILALIFSPGGGYWRRHGGVSLPCDGSHRGTRLQTPLKQRKSITSVSRGAGFPAGADTRHAAHLYCSLLLFVVVGCLEVAMAVSSAVCFLANSVLLDRRQLTIKRRGMSTKCTGPLGQGCVPFCVWMTRHERCVSPLVSVWLVLRLPEPNYQGLDMDLHVLKPDSRESTSPSVREADKAAGPVTEEYRKQVCHTPLSHVAAGLFPHFGNVFQTYVGVRRRFFSMKRPTHLSFRKSPCM